MPIAYSISFSIDTERRSTKKPRQSGVSFAHSFRGLVRDVERVGVEFGFILIHIQYREVVEV